MGSVSTWMVGERLTGVRRGRVNFVYNPKDDAGFLVEMRYLIFDFLSWIALL